jgi:RNA-splicing ligase RtcB
MERQMTKYFCDIDGIEKNALEQIELFEMNGAGRISVFPDIHYCSEKNLPVGVSFKSQDFYPLITGKDLGCGVMYLKYKKEDIIKAFNKNEHYRTFEKQSYLMTDDGLGGGNHFLSIEEGDDGFMYIICHTGSRNLGISLYHKFVRMIEDFNFDETTIGKKLPKSKWTEELAKYYESVLVFASNRRKEFVLKTLMMLQTNGYVKCDKTKIDKAYLKNSFKHLDDEGKLNGTYYKIQDSIHNHIKLTNGEFIHRKGATELISGRDAVIPLSMTRGSLIVRPSWNIDMLESSNYSCSHGAGRRLSRTDSLKHWNSGMKKKEKEQYKKDFFELLDRSGNFPNGYIQ